MQPRDSAGYLKLHRLTRYQHMKSRRRLASRARRAAGPLTGALFRPALFRPGGGSCPVSCGWRTTPVVSLDTCQARVLAIPSGYANYQNNWQCSLRDSFLLKQARQSGRDMSLLPLRRSKPSRITHNSI